MRVKEIEQLLKENNIEYRRVYPRGIIKFWDGKMIHYRKFFKQLEQQLAEEIRQENIKDIQIEHLDPIEVIVINESDDVVVEEVKPRKTRSDGVSTRKLQQPKKKDCGCKKKK